MFPTRTRKKKLRFTGQGNSSDSQNNTDYQCSPWLPLRGRAPSTKTQEEPPKERERHRMWPGDILVSIALLLTLGFNRIFQILRQTNVQTRNRSGSAWYWTRENASRFLQGKMGKGPLRHTRLGGRLPENTLRYSFTPKFRLCVQGNRFSWSLETCSGRHEPFLATPLQLFSHWHEAQFL